MNQDSGTYIELDDGWDEPGWTRIPNSIARCKTISRRLKGWILEVASHERGRRITFAAMVAASTDGRDATYATIKEGITAGFITRRQERDESGRVGVVVYRLHQVQQTPRSDPLPGMPDTAEPVTANPETSKKTKKDLEDYKEPLLSEVADATTDQEPPRPDVDQLCGQLRDAMITNGCKPPTITRTWRKTARLLLDRDKRPLAEAAAVLAWCQADEFWKANIQSLPTFRAQYDKLRLRWEQTRPVEHPSSPETIKEWLRAQWKLGHVTEIEERTKLRYTPPPLPDHIKTVDQARDFHAEQIRAWITEHNDEITRLLTAHNDQQEAS